jgi:alpha-mannosidase
LKNVSCAMCCISRAACPGANVCGVTNPRDGPCPAHGELPGGLAFCVNLEVLWGADLFLQRKPQAERDEFIDAVKNGWISINGMYANELTGLCRPEELLQIFRYSKVLSKLCGVSVNSAMLSDVPGYTWGTITAMSQAGIRYFSAAPNGSDRIGTIRPAWHDKPFWHVSRSGKEKVLVWMPGHGYTLCSQRAVS